MIRPKYSLQFAPRAIAGIFLAASLLAGCAGSGGATREKTSQQWYDEGARLAASGRYPEALEAFEEATKGYRNADLDSEIRLALADTYFSHKEHASASEAYAEFLRLHPHNGRADYAQYRVGLSWLKQMGGADRSPEPAHKAAAAFAALLRGYPRSAFLPEAREGLVAARRGIAEHELAVGDFYLRTGRERAAVGRYEVVLREYADLGFADRALYEMGRCYRRLHESEKAESLFEQLRREYPESRFIKEIGSTKG